MYTTSILKNVWLTLSFLSYEAIEVHVAYGWVDNPRIVRRLRAVIAGALRILKDKDVTFCEQKSGSPY